MTIAEQYTQALEQVKLFAEVDTEPKLSVDELQTIISREQRASVWTANKAYSVGDTILPTVGNGHRYVCTQAGTSGATEPIWSRAMGAIAADGTSDPQLRWREDGPAFKNVYNVRSAIQQAWMLKAGKVSDLYRTGANQSSAAQSEVFDHCLDMAKRWEPLEIS